MPFMPSSKPEHPTKADRSVSDRLTAGNTVYLYGAGSIGRDAIAILQRAGLKVRAVLDAKILSFSAIQGVPVQRPDDPGLSPDERREATVVISIFNAFVDIPALKVSLSSMGWGNIIGFTDFFEAFAPELGNRYWLTSRGYYDSHEADLAHARALLADEKSRQVFDSIMRFRRSGDYGVLSIPDREDQYFPRDLPEWGKTLRIIDCGAFDGDTLRQLRTLGLSVEAYAGFEPDLINFAKLSHEATATLAGCAGKALWPCGVWHSVSQLHFSTGQGAGSAIAAGGETVIQCVSLDEALPGFEPNLIKMDIEGAEPAALKGAARMIQRARPGLAVCIYHEPAHLWEIPRLIHEWQLGYRFYLRCHQYSGFDLVLYAVPS
jgi:FkbM family methyltransferase